MFTDIVGYTAITQSDESHAMQLLKRHNELLRPIFQKHNGLEIKTIGDAFLIEFESALEAVLCAMEIQERLRDYNASRVAHDDADTEADKIQVRIGIHLGDVIHQENDVFGDAVNIASRIQPIAGPGGICVSTQVYDQIANKVPFRFEKKENVKLKNVIFPVDVYTVVMPLGADSEDVSRERARQEPDLHPNEEKGESAAAFPLKRRLAVLPLASIGLGQEDEFFAEGLTEELITVLSNIKDLRVIAKTSISRYRGSNKSVSEIGRELNVGSILEGSIRKTANRVRVTVQVTDVASEEHVWASSYDGQLDDIFTVQSDIARKVSRTLKAKLRDSEKARISKKPTQSMDAYSLYLKGHYALNIRSKQGMEEAMKYFEQAIARDHRYAKAFAGLADCSLLMGSYGYLNAKEAYTRARELVSQALQLDENLPEAHVSLGFLLEAFYYDFAGAREQFEHAISLSPSNSQARHWYAISLAISNRLDEAIGELQKAWESDPLSPQIGTVLGGFYSYKGMKDEALQAWERVLKSNPNNVPLYLNRGIFYAKHHMEEEALADTKKALRLSSYALELKCLLGYVYAVLGHLDESLSILGEVKSKIEAGEEHVPPFYMAILYAGLGDNEQCLLFIDLAIKDRSAEIESLIHDSMFDRVRSDPRYLEMLKKLGLAHSGTMVVETEGEGREDKVGSQSLVEVKK